jgi:Holliday junction resolvase
MVKPYRKGYMAERQMVHTLSEKGFMVVRTPHSGSISLASPDIIAAKNNRLVVIECKAHNKGFQVAMEQLAELQQWKDRAGAEVYVAWKMLRKGWHFMHLKDVVENKGNVGKKFAEQKAFSLERMIGNEV